MTVISETKPGPVWDIRMEKVENPSGIVPLDLAALVYPDPVEGVTQGGIIIPPSAQTRQKYATQKATLIAVGGSCFAEWIEKPKPGQRILIVQYAGTRITGPKDGREYNVIRDDEIVAILEEE